MLQYLHDKGVDAVEIVWYQEYIYTFDTYDGPSWDANTSISYRMDDGRIVTWDYDGTMGSFIEYHLGPLEMSYDELDSDPLSLS